MKIAIFYICIGKYNIFFDEFYASAKKYLFTNQIRHFYVFTDDEKLLKSDNYSDVSFIYYENLGWPFNTLYRFKMFMYVGDDIKNYDYAYFFNANAYFVKKIDNQIIPTNGEIVVVKHFKYANDKDKYNYPLDRNKKCWANVCWGKEGNDYIQACFFGATGNEFYSLSKYLSDKIDFDVKNNVIALWHDESYLNKYIIGKVYTILSVSFAYPESLNLNYDKTIIMRNKERYLNLQDLRNQKKSLFFRIKIKINNQIPKIKILMAKICRYFKFN